MHWPDVKDAKNMTPKERTQYEKAVKEGRYKAVLTPDGAGGKFLQFVKNQERFAR
jgi:hypothetical protein